MERQRFLSDAGMLAALDEPALVKVLQFWKQHGTAYMAMPLYEGQTLNDVLRNSPKPCEAWLKAILGPLLDALATLHRFDCYPCDVTPDNIVVLDDGTPLLLAFGAGRRIVADTTEELTLDLNPGFAPIEQFAHDPTMPEGPWTDIYAVAAVLHFAITGKPLPAPAARMVSDTLPHLRDANGDYSASFLDAVERGLAVLPGDRPQTIAEFRAALGIPSITPGGMPTARPAASPAAPNTAGRTASLLARTWSDSAVRRAGGYARIRTAGRIAGDAAVVLRTGTNFAHAVVASRDREFPGRGAMEARRATDRRRARSRSVFLSGPWASLVSRLRQPWTAPCRCSRCRPARNRARLSQRRQLTTQSVLPPVAANPPVADPAPQRGAVPDAGAVAPVPRNVRRRPAHQRRPAPRTGKVRFSIKPWGEIIIDGKRARRESTHQGAFHSGRSPSDRDPERHLSRL